MWGRWRGNIQANPRLQAVAALYERQIITDYRPGAVRISPYFYNTVEENEIVIQALKEISKR